MLVEIHMLQSHGPSNPNRDDLGAPKTAMFGGVLRARISSQCIKRSIRWHPVFRDALKDNLGSRTVKFPDLVSGELKDSDIPEADHDKVVEACAGIANKKKRGSEDEDHENGREEATQEAGARTEQLIFLGPDEAKEFVRILAELRKDLKFKKDYDSFLNGGSKARPSKKFYKRLREAYQPGVDIALFGRMVTSDAFEGVEASMQVAHAISTHGVVPETDYYTAVDDQQPKEQTGAGFIGEAQYASALFYKYLSFDWGAFLKNLGGDIELARTALGVLLEAAALAVPTGKRNSYANNNLPDAILVEVKDRNVATSYVNAFLQPAGRYSDSAGDHDLLDDSICRLRHYANALSKTYGIEGNRFWLATRKDPLMDSEQMKGETLKRVSTLSDLRDAVLKALEEAAHA